MTEERPKEKKVLPVPNERLKQERLLRNWTHAEVAELIGISDPHTVSRWERGVAFPSPLSRQRLCDLFGKSEEELGLVKKGLNEELEPTQTREENVAGQQRVPPITVPLSAEERAKLRQRQWLIAKVRAAWITGVLERALYDAARIVLGLQEERTAVASPWQHVVHHLDTSPRSLPSNTPITQVYDEVGGELLVLGEPGSGKTTLLLELARDLLARAEQDSLHPIPVVFNLSSWTEKRQSLSDWLVGELNTKYQVPRVLGQAWVDAEQILPLLDGLDEVPLTGRSGCIETINTYRQEHGLSPLVVCSRRTDYFAQTARFLLHAAVVVLPLTDRQIDAYLSGLGEQVAALRLALHDDPALRELAATPLMLSVLTQTYHDIPIEHLLATESQAALRHQVFATYVQRMLHYRGTKVYYSQSQATQWLAQLARQMVQSGQTVFYIERMQPDWLPSRGAYRFYRGGVARIAGGLTVGLGSLQTMTVNVGLGYGLCYCMISMLFFFLLGEPLFGLDTETQTAEVLLWSWKSLRRKVVRILVGSLVGALLLGLAYGIGYGRLFGPSEGLWFGVDNGFPDGVFFGVVGVLASFLGSEITPAEVVAWSWKSMRISFVQSLRVGLIAGFTFGMIVGLTHGLLYGNLPDGLSRGVIAGVNFALVLSLIYGLRGGLSSETLDEHSRVRPNQGIWRSARNSAIVALVTALVTFVVTGLVSGVQTEAQTGLIYGLTDAVLGGLIGGILGGGIACLKHCTLRVLLWRMGAIPWNYPRFLNYAAERILLRRVGGGYIFVHRLLLDYFASLDIASVPGKPGEVIQSAP